MHGFTLTGEQFSPAADLLSRRVIAPDLPGHGFSRDHGTDAASTVTGIHSVLDELAESSPLMGYSQGGRMALLSVIDGHPKVASLVLISSSPGISSTLERGARMAGDRKLAERIMNDGLEAFIASWTSSDITSTSHLSEEFRRWDTALRLENSPEGLAAALSGYGQGAQPSVWHDLADLALPVLLITGRRDERYVSISENMAELIPSSEIAIIDDAGHNPLADQPHGTYKAISGFLDRQG